MLFWGALFEDGSPFLADPPHSKAFSVAQKRSEVDILDSAGVAVPNVSQALSDGVTDKRLAILRGVANTGSISEAARQAGVSYKSAWQAIETLSNLAGLDAGVKRLSEVNMVLAIVLLVFVIVVGPTLAIIIGFFSNLGAYLAYLPALGNPVGREDTNFAQGWTAFYWAWWISWSPFVGMFIARVSRGRSVREFLVSVLIVPSLACVLWMTVFGNTAISQVVNQGYLAVTQGEVPLQIFLMLDALPLAQITSLVAIILVVVFFVTSSDSGSLVIDVIASGGKVVSPAPQRIFWCTFEGLVAVALILGGGLVALQAMAVSTGFPFAIVLLVSTISLIKGLMSEPRPKKQKKNQPLPS